MPSPSPLRSRLRSRRVPLAAAALALLGAGCGGEIGGTAGAVAPPDDRDVTAAEAMLALDAITLGSRLAGDGSVDPASATATLRPGGTAYLSMEVGDAAPGSEVRVVWYGPRGHEVAATTRRVRQGQRSMTFSLATADRPPGPYRGEVWFGNERVRELTLRVGAPPPLRPEGTVVVRRSVPAAGAAAPGAAQPGPEPAAAADATPIDAVAPPPAVASPAPVEAPAAASAAPAVQAPAPVERQVPAEPAPDDTAPADAPPADPPPTR